MKRNTNKSFIIFDIIKKHIYNNSKLYLTVSIFFIIGIIMGVTFANNIESDVQSQVSEYINDFIYSLKTDYEIDSISLLKSSIQSHILFTFLIWFMGCTVIGIPVVYGLVILKGFSLSYTISTIISTLGLGKGIWFCIISLLFQNIITIPTILALAVSGIRLYKSIMKDKRRENIKIEIIRHTIFSLSMLILFIISSFVEVYISSNLMSLCINTL